MRPHSVLILLLSALSWSLPAWAQDPARAPIRAVIRIQPDHDRSREIWTRLGGQTVDLAVTLVRVDDRGERRITEQLAAASQLARAHSARIVVWFRSDPSRGGIRVYIAEPGADSVFVRYLAQPSDSPDARSASAEAVALVVRSGLRALAQGADIGVPSREVVRADQAAAAAASTAASATEPTSSALPNAPSPPPPTNSSAHASAPAAPRSAHAPRRSLSPTVAIGWQASRDGLQRYGHHGLLVRAGASLGANRNDWSLRVALAGYPEAATRDPLTVLYVARHGASVGLWRRVRTGPLWLEAALSAGATRFVRRTEALADGVTETPAQATWCATLGPSAGAHWPLLTRPAHQLGLFFHLAVDVVLGAPRFSYLVAGQLETRAATEPVQPRASAGLRWQF
ncbi:MAG: hypothetical protein Tsb0020_19220 [Haliangiales bacterium]